MSRYNGDSDAEGDAATAQQGQYDGMDELDRMPSIGSNQDIHAQLQAAATPLEFQATLETKFASYDNYCNLFHYILNSEGPVDLEVPNVSEPIYYQQCGGRERRRGWFCLATACRRTGSQSLVMRDQLLRGKGPAHLHLCRGRRSV